MRIGIIDLVNHRRENNLQTRIINPNGVSLASQYIAVWLEKLGHNIWYYTYTGVEDLKKDLNLNLDVLFIASFTTSAYLAYSISNLYRRYGIITILGGPHAVSYPHDSIKYFDYVLGMTDESLLKDIIYDLTPNDPGIYLTNNSHPTDVPTLKERWKYVEYNHKKILPGIPKIVPMMSSIGCPYKCEFCIDSKVTYKKLDPQLIKENLYFLKTKYPTWVVWYDPNFGVNLDENLDIIDQCQTKNIKYLTEMNLTRLTILDVLKLRKQNFIGIAPGLESWSSYNEKTLFTKPESKIDKVKTIAEQVNMITEYIPLLQLNIIFGLDCDEGQEPFELTKEFIKLTPSAYTNFQTITSFGKSTPFGKQLFEQNRLLNVPYNLLDCFTTTNIKLNYNLKDFYTYYADLVKFATSNKVIAKRLLISKTLPGKLFYLIKRLAGRGNYKYYEWFINQLDTKEFKDFYSGETTKPPRIYRDQLEKELGPFYVLLPAKIIQYFKYGVT